MEARAQLSAANSILLPLCELELSSGCQAYTANSLTHRLFSMTHLLFGDRLSLSCLDWPQPHSIAQTGLNLCFLSHWMTGTLFPPCSHLRPFPPLTPSWIPSPPAFGDPCLHLDPIFPALGPHHVLPNQSGLKLTELLLPLPPKCWGLEAGTTTACHPFTWHLPLLDTEPGFGISCVCSACWNLGTFVCTVLSQASLALASLCACLMESF